MAPVLASALARHQEMARQYPELFFDQDTSDEGQAPIMIMMHCLSHGTLFPGLVLGPIRIPCC